jgi:hypothetical protein
MGPQGQGARSGHGPHAGTLITCWDVAGAWQNNLKVATSSRESSTTYPLHPPSPVPIYIYALSNRNYSCLSSRNRDQHVEPSNLNSEAASKPHEDPNPLAPWRQCSTAGRPVLSTTRYDRCSLGVFCVPTMRCAGLRTVMNN